MCRGGYVANWIPVQEENERRIPLGYHMVTIGDPRKQRICKGYAKDTKCALPSEPSVPSVPSGDLRILGSTAARQGFASVEEFSSLKGRIW